LTGLPTFPAVIAREKRAIQYSEAPVTERKSRGVLDTPLCAGYDGLCGASRASYPTDWHGFTFRTAKDTTPPSRGAMRPS